MTMNRRTLFVTLLALAALFTLSLAVPGTVDAATGMQEPESQQEPDTHAPADDHAEQDDHAADDEHAEEEAKPWFYWPSKWINFLLLSGFLYWMLVVPPQAIQDIFTFPGLKVVFVERAAGIIAARDLAAQQKQDAATMLTDSEQRLTKIEDEVAALVAEAKQDAEAEGVRAVEDGKLQADKIHQVAQREIGHQRTNVQRQLRGFVADLAVNMAEKNLAEHLTAEDQDRLIREYLSRLGPNMA